MSNKNTQMLKERDLRLNKENPDPPIYCKFDKSIRNITENHPDFAIFRDLDIFIILESSALMPAASPKWAK